MWDEKRLQNYVWGKMRVSKLQGFHYWFVVQYRGERYLLWYVAASSWGACMDFDKPIRLHNQQGSRVKGWKGWWIKKRAVPLVRALLSESYWHTTEGREVLGRLHVSGRFR